MNQAVQYGGAPLTVYVRELSPYVMGQWIGAGLASARDVARDAAAELVARPGQRLVLDLSQLTHVSAEVVQALARSITEAHRVGRTVYLVRCEADLFHRLQQAGVNNSVYHVGSLLAATQGMVGKEGSSLDLHLRSSAEMLPRLRRVMSAIVQEAGFSQGAEMAVVCAVNEAVTNAIVHGSPEGERNHVRVSAHLEGDMLIVDVADQGRGFDPDAVVYALPNDLRESGFGLELMRQSMDRLEFFRDEPGMLVRMTKLLVSR